jgi:hypothetical protein
MLVAVVALRQLRAASILLAILRNLSIGRQRDAGGTLVAVVALRHSARAERAVGET